MKNKILVKPKKKWGQHFISDNNTIIKIIKLIGPSEKTNIIEIGPGKGALTFPLSKIVKSITAIEIDENLVDELKKNKMSNMKIINKDILKYDYNSLSNDKMTNLLIIGNLPYNISSQIIIKLIEFRNYEKLVFMIQKDLANRLLAKKSSKNYSRISIISQIFFEIEKNFAVSKNIFYPKPNVDSVMITMKHKKISNIDFVKLSGLLKKCFSQRRKKIKNTLSNYVSADIIKKYGDLRPQDLTIEDFLTLYHKITPT